MRVGQYSAQFNIHGQHEGIADDVVRRARWDFYRVGIQWQLKGDGRAWFLGKIESNFRCDRLDFANWLHVKLQNEIRVGSNRPGHVVRIKSRQLAGLPTRERDWRFRSLRRMDSPKAGLSIFSVEFPNLPC